MILRVALFSLLCLTGASLAAQSAPSNTLGQTDKHKLAEHAADQVMQRFYETVDFKTIYDEMYVSPPLKTEEIQIILRNILLKGIRLDSKDFDPNMFGKIDFSAMERAYLALQNFQFLVSAMNFTSGLDETKLDGELKVELEQYYMPMMDPKNWPIRTSAELDSRFTANYEHMNQFMRKYIVAKNYNTDLYRKRVASFKESRGPEEALERLFGLNQKIYTVRRERLHLYFVEENGTFKMLTVTNRVQD
jgi:hypothetical protein